MIVVMTSFGYCDDVLDEDYVNVMIFEPELLGVMLVFLLNWL